LLGRRHLCHDPHPGPRPRGEGGRRGGEGGRRRGAEGRKGRIVVAGLFSLALAMLLAIPSSVHAQGPALGQATEVPEGPKPLEDFEVDTDADGIPDGWYNLRDAKLVEGGVGGP